MGNKETVTYNIPERIKISFVLRLRFD